MEKAGITVGAGKITDYLVVPVLEKFLRPIFCFQSIVDDFKEQNSRLIAIRERVETEVRRDKDNGQVIYDSVEKWLKEVNEDVMPKVPGMNERLKKNKSCFRYSWCPGWTCHYRFSKQVSEMAATMKTLCELSTSFGSLSRPPALQQNITRSSSSGAFVHSQSSRSAFDQIMEALKRVDINLIGLYGAAGAGKTTLAQQVGAEAKKFFKHVIMVPVSQHPQVRSMQGVIADFLGLQFDHQESDQGRAAKLQLRLNNGEKIFIIIDDVVQVFCLDAVVGIPSVDCKILLTTNAETHVPGSMHTQEHILLGALSEGEAWTLFKNIAGVGEELSKYDVAKDALEECNGLPKAIVAMGTILNGKGILEWRDTLQQHNTAKFKIIDCLKEGVKKLSLRQERVNTKIKMAKQNVEEIYPDVEKWLEDVERVKNDFEQYQNELNQNRWCIDELGLATRVEALATCVKDLNKEGNFDKVSHPTPLEQDMRLLPSEDFLFSEAAISGFDQILKALRTNSVNIIGLYGMGGIGKTTLASQVHNEVIRENAKAVMVTVSQKPDVGNMQDKIADFLDIELKKRTLDERAIELKNRLKNEKILIILDDVWKRFDLRSVGIMLDDCKGCKVLMTTRGRDVCSSMECQQEIQLHLFSEDESLKFFTRKAGLSNELELDDVEKQIVAECKCLPIALGTVGAALKRKGKDEWVEALEKLRNSRLVDIIGVGNDEKNVYKCLQISYEYLNDQPESSGAQFILLLCSLFPEDYEIKVEDLTRYVFGMKLFEKVESIEDARRKVRVMIRFLRDSCLLLDVGGEKYVKMHDVVRDVLIWIGGTESHERNTLTVRDDVSLKDLIRKKSFQSCKALSLSSQVIPKFSKYSKLEFPNLEIVLIFIREDHEFLELGEGFFEHMKLLRVLDFRSERRWGKCKFEMPQSLHCLEYLRTLMLRNCECSNSSILRDLGRLRILSLLDCEIDCGVEVMSRLKKLRLLDLMGFWAPSRMFTSDGIEALVKLEELHGYIFKKFKLKDQERHMLSEFKLPSKLVALSVKVEDVMCLPTDFCFPNLATYKIYIGFYRLRISSNISQGRHLVLRGDIGDESVMINTCKKLFPTVRVFRLRQCDDMYSLLAFSLPMLEKLEVSECKEMKCVLKVGNISNNNKSIVQILSLKILRLFVLRELRHIWEGPTSLLSLSNLTELSIANCPKLICIFSSSGGSGDVDDFTCCCCFTNLRTLIVSRCYKVKTIFPLMKSSGRAPHLHPQSHPCRLPKLEKIFLDKNYRLEHIFGHKTEAEEGVECPSLQVLDVTFCPKISTALSVATQQQAPSSKTVKKLKLAHIQGEDDNEDGDLLTPPFNNLSPWNSKEVKCIPRGSAQNIRFADLYHIKVIGCHKLKHLFAIKIATNFPKLKRLIVQGCNELEEVIMVEDGKDEWEDDSISNTEMMAKVGFENLEVLHVSNCRKLKTVFSTFIHLLKLDTLILQSNAVLESLFGQSDCYCTPHWTHLKVLSVGGCPKLCTETIAIVKSQVQAQSLTKELSIFNLSNIQGVEEIVQFQQQDDDDDEKEEELLDLKRIWSEPTQDISFSYLGAQFQRQDDATVEIFQLQRQFQILRLEKLGDLKRIWNGPRQDISFSYLGALRVIGCNRLKHLFTATMATSLHNLFLLSVERCYELEQVIQEEGNEENNIQSIQLDFSKLQILRLIDLPKLISFCPTSCNLVFSNLMEKRLKVKGCSKPITDFFSKQSYQEEDECGFEDDYDSEDEDEEDDDDDEEEYEYDSVREDEEGDEEHEDEKHNKYSIYKIVNELLGLRPKD